MCPSVSVTPGTTPLTRGWALAGWAGAGVGARGWGGARVGRWGAFGWGRLDPVCVDVGVLVLATLAPHPLVAGPSSHPAWPPACGLACGGPALASKLPTARSPASASRLALPPRPPASLSCLALLPRSPASLSCLGLLPRPPASASCLGLPPRPPASACPNPAPPPPRNPGLPTTNLSTRAPRPIPTSPTPTHLESQRGQRAGGASPPRAGSDGCPLRGPPQPARHSRRGRILPISLHPGISDGIRRNTGRLSQSPAC